MSLLLVTLLFSSARPTDMQNGSDGNIAALWREIVEIHNETKTLFLLAEEIDHKGFKTFLQPLNEHRHAYEHVIRCKASEFDLGAHPNDSDYQWKSLSRALGHEYRGFFDCADWLSVTFREHILESTYRYGPDCILAALPDYYSEIQPRIDEICEDIARMRGSKDIAQEEDSADEEVTKSVGILAEVQEYRDILSELYDLRKQIARKIPSMESHRKKTTRGTLWCSVCGIGCALIGAFLLWFTGWICGPYFDPAPTDPPKRPVEQGEHKTPLKGPASAAPNSNS